MKRQRRNPGKHLEPQYGLDDGFVMPIDLFIDVARCATAPMVEFTVHAAGFPRPHDVDVLFVTVRARCKSREKGTERLQFRVYGILPAEQLKTAIWGYLRAKDRYLPEYEIERMIYK